MPPSPPPPATVVDRLRAAGCVFAEDEARLVVTAADNPTDLDTMIERRRTGTPLEHVLGWARFCGHRITVTPGVFVPRRRTEFLVHQAIAHIAAPTDDEPTTVVDLCCGSGAIGAAVLAVVDHVDLHAVDIDPTAVACAHHNLTTPNTHIHHGDLYQPLPKHLRGRVDLILANAPYVPTATIGLLPPEARTHEPRVALDGGTDGLDIHRRVADGAPQWLTPGGHLIIETSHDQAPRTADTLRRHGLNPHITRCEELDATVVIGTRAPRHTADLTEPTPRTPRSQPPP